MDLIEGSDEVILSSQISHFFYHIIDVQLGGAGKTPQPNFTNQILNK